MKRRVIADCRGAILLMGLFMALLSAGALYYLVGIAEAVIMKERMQDAADATAYSAAVIHARGMNILVLFNMIMALLIALLMLFNMLISILRAAKMFALAMAWLFPGLLSVVPPLNVAEANLVKVKPKVEEVVDRGLRTLDSLSDATRRAVPAISLAKSLTIAPKNYAAPTQLGVTFPIYESLPVQDGDYKTLCLKAGDYVEGASTRVLSYFSIGSGRVTRFIGKLVGKAVDQYSKLFCGDGGSFEQTYKETYTLPNLSRADLEACEEQSDEAACDRAQAYMDDFRASFQESTGTCAAVSGDSGSPEEIQSTCERHLAASREVCHPDSDGGGIAKNGWNKWRYRYERAVISYALKVGPKGRREVVKTGEKVEFSKIYFNKGVRRAFDPADPDAFTYPQQRTPCLAGWTPWERDPTRPVCGEVIDEPSPDDFAGDGHEIDVSQDRISDILFCRESKKQKIKHEVEGSSSDVTFEEHCDCSHLGEERFQIRALVMGDASGFLRRARKNIKVADAFGVTDLGDYATASKIVDVSEFLGRGSIAQAEFYFGEAGVPRSEWMWNISWTARLRRTTLSGLGGGSCAADSVPEETSRTCTAMYGMDSVLSRIEGGGNKSPLGPKNDRKGAFDRFLGALDIGLVH